MLNFYCWPFVCVLRKKTHHFPLYRGWMFSDYVVFRRSLSRSILAIGLAVYKWRRFRIGYEFHRDVCLESVSCLYIRNPYSTASAIELSVLYEKFVCRIRCIRWIDIVIMRISFDHIWNMSWVVDWIFAFVKPHDTILQSLFEPTDRIV